VKDYSLPQLQNWMKTVLTVRGDLKEKLETAAGNEGLRIEHVVKGRKSISAHRRLDIYAAGYVMRLVECLKKEFSVLCSYMGEEFFEVFAKAYIVTIPSENWSLYYLGERFSSFLQNTQPHSPNDSEQAAFVALPAQIARFERAKAEVLLAKGLENNTNAPISETEYVSAFLQGQMRVQTPPCLRLIRLEYPILELVDCVEKSKEYKMPQLGESFLAISRIDYQITITELEDWQFSFLSQCADPISVCEAAHKIHSGLKPSDLLARLLIWLLTIDAYGLIVSID
jgi:hypothetical protein